MRASHSKTAIVVFLTVATLSLPTLSDSSPRCKAWLVQSIPTDMPRLPRVAGVLSTADVFQWLAGNASRRLDVIAQYWQLVASPEDTRSGDYGYSKKDMKRFGAFHGDRVYKALERAADRNVSIRLLSHSGVYPDYAKEPSDLAFGRPNVKSVVLLLDQWWGSGIVHAKVWISNRRHVYIGSANNDWKSLTQVKEVGIYLEDCPKIATKVEAYFDNLWTLPSLNSSAQTRNITDLQWQIERQVPCWSHFIQTDKRCSYPFPPVVKIPHVIGYPPLSDPVMFKLPIQTPGSNYSTLKPRWSYVSFSPPELSFGRYQTDEQGWLDTINSVGKGATLRISTMDWLGQSEFAKQTVYWSSLSSAISEAVFSKQAKVKLIVAYWAHFINNTDQYLRTLLYSNDLCSSSEYNHCDGKIEIKYYMIPGFNATGPAISHGKKTGNAYPGFTRVNHGKYAVSDVRAHISTSNLVWDYFYTTAGVSFGTYHPGVVAQLQEVFDADWNSPYAVPLLDTDGGYPCQRLAT